MDKLLPRWAVVLGADPVLRADFNEWVTSRCSAYAHDAVIHAADMADLKGFRFMVGELEALKAMINWTVEENQRRQYAISEVATGESKSRRRRRKRDAGE